MATTTSNLGLVKPTEAEYALITEINANSDKIDAEVGKERSNFALVQNGDTATQAISKDQLVVWKGVLKKATANIANGATLSGSNLSDDTIAAEIASLNTKIASIGDLELLANETNIPATVSSEITVYLSHYISTYKQIVFMPGYGNNYYSSFIFFTSLIIQKNIQLIGSPDDGPLMQLYVKNGSVDINTVSKGWTSLAIYGVK